ncbi:hypothetical protein X961_4308 [Burkholderia pseudomallei MSHR5613]|nr:hypothetical protein X961_4308 [Burkholderia pseudomallei MSHR5613]
MGNGGYLTRRARFQAVVGLRQYDAWMAHRNGPKARQSCAAGGEARTLAGRGVRADCRCAAAFIPFVRVDEVLFFLFA